MTYNEILIGKLKTNRTFLDLVEKWAGYDFSKQLDDNAWHLLDALVNYKDTFGEGQNHLSIDFVIDYINYKLFTKICCRIFIDKFAGTPDCTIRRSETDGEHLYSLVEVGSGRAYSDLYGTQMITFRFVEETPVKNSQEFGIRAFYEEPIPVSFKNCELLDHVLKFRWYLNQEKDVEVRLRDFNKNMFQELIDGVRK